MAHHQLFEWERRRFDADDAIPVSEAGRLVRAAIEPANRLRGAQRAFDFGRDALTAQNLVGVVAAGDTSCEILPKIDRYATGDATALRRQLIGMLGVAHDVPIADDAATTLDTQDHTLLEILITRFATMAHDAVRRGIPRTYVTHDEDLPALRGRLDVTRQFTTLAATPHRLACHFDEFSDDTALNQVMKAAIHRLRQLARSHANQRSLSELALIYADVSDVPAALLRWDRIVVDRTNSRWQELLRLSKLILGDRFQNSAAGVSDGFALLFDMNALFERYVARLLDPIAAGFDMRLLAQGGRRPCLYPETGEIALFETEPDLRLLCRGGNVVVVLDTKWKALTPDRNMGVKEADLYQMMAYAQIYDCSALVLLYPDHAGLNTPLLAHHRIAQIDGPVRLTVAAIDVTTHARARTGLTNMLAETLRSA
ncbi:McrC family protein [Sphingomonas parapaucimobilis]|uniref:McrC family protein n=1 Tax=Sphingomonas parapaucimobilis TaxID=28213 RepID=UPI00321BFD91